MFTPVRKPFPATDRKGKAVAFSDELTTPSPSKVINNGRFGDTLGHAVDDWQKCKEVGLLNEASLDRKDRDALLEMILKLEQELFDYQHNMGLLLIEKKKWTLTNEELQQAFDEASEILKRERSSNLIALNEAQKREENLKKALISEKQFVAELERDLKFMQQEHCEMKSTSEAKLAEANALVMATNETALEVDKKRTIAEENLSVINRKSSELERKLKEVETREKVLQREHLSLVTEREAHEAVFYKQREDLQEWEKKLTIKEDRLSEAKRSIKHIEEKAIESERTTKKKEKLLEEMQQKIDIAKSELKAKEEALNIMLNDISLKERDFEAMKTKIDVKEKELHELEEKLIAREKMEIGKLLDDQKAVLDSRRLEFEMELERMRISLDEEHEKKKGEIEQLRVEIGHKGEQLRKREASLEIMEERLKEKEKDLEARLKAVEEKEYALKDEEKMLHMENERLLEDKETLRKLKDEIEEIGAETTEQESRIREEHESLRITKEERLEFLRLQSELKQQIDRVKQQEELLWKECEELKQDKRRFEKEWEALDEKKADITREQKEVTKEMEKLRNLQISQKVTLKIEEMTSGDNLKRELDDVKMQKESFEADMEIKKLPLHENAKNKTSQLVEELVNQRRNLDMELQRQEEEDENINFLKKLAQREMEEMQNEKLVLEREREEVSVQKKKLEKQSVELLNDATEVDELRISLKEQREELCCAKERFEVFLKKIKICNSCGEKFEKIVQTVENGDKLSKKEIFKAEEAFNTSRAAENSRSASLVRKLSSVKLPESSQLEDTLDTVAGDDHETSATKLSFTDSRIQGPEVSLQSEIKNDKPRRGRSRSKSVRGRPQSTKVASRDSKPSDGEIPRKRQREHASRITESEHATGDSDEGVDSITSGGHRKKRQTAIPVSQTSGQSRYHLRRHRNVEKEEDKALASTTVVEKEENVNVDIRAVPNPKDNLAPLQGENRDNEKAEILVEPVTDADIITVEALEDPQLKVGGRSSETKEHGEDGYGYLSLIEEENEEEETECPGDASIGKKIWVFFTT